MEQLELPLPPPAPKVRIASMRITAENWGWALFLFRQMPGAFITVWNPFTGGRIITKRRGYVEIQ